MISKSDFDAFIETAWTDHVDQTERVAERLQQSLGWLDESERIAPYARLVTHVFGEHLARWDDGVALLDALRGCSGWRGSDADEGAVRRGVAVLQYSAGKPGQLDDLSTEDQIAVLATASTAILGRGDYHRAITTFQLAEQRVDASLPVGAAAFRTLAIGGNNLAAGLEEKAERDTFESQGMVAAAEAGLKYWTLAGSWLQQERAEYRLTRSLLKAGRSQEAIEHAQACLALCAANDAAPFEHFFGFAVLAIAQRTHGDASAFEAARAQAREFYTRVPAEEQAWCADDLAQLEA